MKTARFILITAVLVGSLGVVAPEISAQPPPAPPPFWEILAQHGTWRNENAYGWYWRPYEADRISTWKPYLTGGSWQWVNDTWSWKSDYIWGEVVFHYGRWAKIAGRGWIWIPGVEQSPAWVEWVQADGAWGWAPTPPAAGFAPGFALSLALQPEDFMFVPEGQLMQRNLDGIAQPGSAPGANPPPQPIVVQSPPQTVVVPPPVYYSESPVVIHQSSGVIFGGATVWPICGYCGVRHGGACTYRGNYRGSYRPCDAPPPRPPRPRTVAPNVAPPARGWSGPRIAPTPAPPPRATPAPRPAPARPVAPPTTAGSRTRLAQPPTTAPTQQRSTGPSTERGKGVKNILDGRR